MSVLPYTDGFALRDMVQATVNTACLKKDLDQAVQNYLRDPAHTEALMALYALFNDDFAFPHVTIHFLARLISRCWYQSLSLVLDTAHAARRLSQQVSGNVRKSAKGYVVVANDGALITIW